MGRWGRLEFGKKIVPFVVQALTLKQLETLILFQLLLELFCLVEGVLLGLLVVLSVLLFDRGKVP